jgi:hypothetical protein
MRQYHEHRIQTILVLLQIGVIGFGTLLIAAMIKAWGYPKHLKVISPYVLFWRNWGYFLIIVPLVWAMGTIWMERNLDGFSKRWTLVTGLFLLLYLAWFLVTMAISAGSTLIQKVPTKESKQQPPSGSNFW